MIFLFVCLLRIPGTKFAHGMFSGNAYANVFPSTSKHDSPDRCYYNFDESKLLPETAISVEDLPDVVLQPEFREKLDQQFDVSILLVIVL